MDLLLNGCSHCGLPFDVLKRCSTCRIVQYCGTGCQKSNWAAHKLICSTPKKHSRALMHQLRKRVNAGEFATHIRRFSRRDARGMVIIAGNGKLMGFVSLSSFNGFDMLPEVVQSHLQSYDPVSTIAVCLQVDDVDGKTLQDICFMINFNQ